MALFRVFFNSESSASSINIRSSKSSQDFGGSTLLLRTSSPLRLGTKVECSQNNPLPLGYFGRDPGSIWEDPQPKLLQFR